MKVSEWMELHVAKIYIIIYKDYIYIMYSTCRILSI